VRSACQRWVMRRVYHMTENSIITSPIRSVCWLPKNPVKAAFAPVGSNVPPPSLVTDPKSRKRHAKRIVSVFAIRDRTAKREIEELALIVTAAAQAAGSFHIVMLGRGSAEADGQLREKLNGTPIDFTCLGLLPAEEVTRTLVQSDVMLFARGPLTCQRGSAIAGITCGLPLVAYSGPQTVPPITEAGVLLAPYRDWRALAKALAEVLTDEDLRRTLHIRSEQARDAYFSWPIIADQILQVLDHA
jgi:glycosyltransferase involved in cell wall biosynthesis